jgi:hypothetical protein
LMYQTKCHENLMTQKQIELLGKIYTIEVIDCS